MMNNLKEQFPKQINLIMLFSQCQVGLSMDDLDVIIKKNPDQYGNWKIFMQEILVFNRGHI